jgi:hypothetical protein
MAGMSEELPVFGGPMDGSKMPAWGPDGYHYEFNGTHYWYFRRDGRWTLAVVNDGAVPPRPVECP